MFRKKIYVPKSLRKKVINWYHHFLCHPGASRLVDTIGLIMTWSSLNTDFSEYTRMCPTCQRKKKGKNKYGRLLAKVAEVVPFDVLCVDLIGPYTVTLTKKQTVTLNVMMFIDPETSWFEICEVTEKTSEKMSQLLDRVWLSRYP